MNVLDLFSGIGGFSLGLERAGMRTIAFCEIDPYCRAVLKKHWPDVPCHDDIRTFKPPPADVVCGGFPCQPFSVAGKRRGAKDDRHLWPSMVLAIAQARPSWVIGENVTGFINMGLDGALFDLENLGYATQAFVIPACAVRAPHRRDRVFIVANSKLSQSRSKSYDGEARRMGWQQQPFPWDRDWQGALREFRGMDDGLSYGVDRVDSIRNAVIPQILQVIGEAIMNVHYG